MGKSNNKENLGRNNAMGPLTIVTPSRLRSKSKIRSFLPPSPGVNSYTHKQRDNKMKRRLSLNGVEPRSSMIIEKEINKTKPKIIPMLPNVINLLNPRNNMIQGKLNPKSLNLSLEIL